MNERTNGGPESAEQADTRPVGNPDQSTIVFDGHNDVLTKLRNAGGVADTSQFLAETGFDIDMIKAASGNFGGGFFAMWVATPGSKNYQDLMVQERYDVPLPARLSLEDAAKVVMEQAAIALKLQTLGAVEICTSVEQISACLGSERLAMVLHLEGCEAIDPDFHTLDVLYAAGLRSLGPVWSRPTIYGEGVPFRFPSTPDIGGGLTEHGLALIRRCNAMGIMIDLSHLNEAGFDDVARHSAHPLVATHSNAHTLCPHARNLTDRQLAIIADSQGMVGLNFASAFLREDGRWLSDVPISQMIRHLDSLLEILGEDGVGLGSDFDGALVPDAISDTTGLPKLINAMREHGYGDALITKLCHGNWLNLLGRTWAAPA